MRLVYPFDHRHDRPAHELTALLGGKGAGLATMTTALGLPVPPGFTITTVACRAVLDGGWPDGLDAEVDEALARLEELRGERLGDPAAPLLLSVRSGAPRSMPGMMDTVLDLGLDDATVAALAEQTADERFAYDSYRRFVAMYGRVVLGVPGAGFGELLAACRHDAGVDDDTSIPAAALASLVRSELELVEEHTGRPFPRSPRQQLRAAIEAVFRSWTSERAVAYRRREGIADDLGTAVNVQVMVFGNRDERSGTGVGFTRDPSTGAAEPYGDFLRNAQGEDVVAGIRRTEPLAAVASGFPQAYAALLDAFRRLEVHRRDLCDVEFTIEQEHLWILQVRVGKRTGAAAVRIAVDLHDDPEVALTPAEAVSRVTPEQLDHLLHPQLAVTDRPLLVTGLAASPGAGVGRAYFDPVRAVEAAEGGEPVVLVRTETSPEDVAGMAVARAVLTSHGGLVSHAAVVARGWGIPAVCGATGLTVGHDAITTEDGTTVHEGDVLSVDGSTGRVFLGEVDLEAGGPPPELERLLSWADELRAGRLGVRANADNAEDAAVARRFGAEGIGLCRTEHLFLGDRLPFVRRVILAEDPRDEEEALAQLRARQRSDFEGLLDAMDGLPVTVRLLDPPLHEFLPSVEELAVAEARHGLDDADKQLLAAARRWHEENPMLGARGVRLAVLKDGLYRAQVGALADAVVARRAAGGDPRIQVMVPLVALAPELRLACGWVRDELRSALGDDADRVWVGTMVETPRAALRAGELAALARFFSFGTNDLTQMTFGFSRDDVADLVERYVADGLLPGDPFSSVDVDGVGELVRLAIERGRAVRPDLEVGVCGEHGGDPASIAFFASVGVDYVSCSPYRVPVARLAAAQAVLRSG